MDCYSRPVQRSDTPARTFPLRHLWWLAALGWAALIFWLSSSPYAQGGGWLLSLFPHADKVAHAVAFGVLASFVYLASGRFWLALALASGYGLIDELHQMTVPGRFPSALDWLADTLGAAGFLLAVRFLKRRWSARRV
jgi:hypothetical protein